MGWVQGWALFPLKWRFTGSCCEPEIHCHGSWKWGFLCWMIDKWWTLAGSHWQNKSQQMDNLYNWLCIIFVSSLSTAFFSSGENFYFYWNGFFPDGCVCMYGIKETEFLKFIPEQQCHIGTGVWISHPPPWVNCPGFMLSHTVLPVKKRSLSLLESLAVVHQGRCRSTTNSYTQKRMGM